ADTNASCPVLPGERLHSCVTESLGLRLRAGVVPAEFHLAAHARPGGHREGACLDVAADHAAFEQLDSLGILDVTEQLAADDDDARLHEALEVGTRVEGDIAVN